MFDRRFFDVSLIVLGIANEPAANSTIGTQYIVGSNPTGAFANANANYIARYNGTTWKFNIPKAGGLEVLNAETGEILGYNGSAWVVKATITSSGSGATAIAPVLAVIPTGTTLPATAKTGDVFLKIDDNKLYTATAANTWDSGTLVANGSRYASLTDCKIYESNGTALEGFNIPDGEMFLNKEDSCVYVYNATTATFSKTGSQAAETVIEYHTLTAEEATAKSFTLENSIATGKEASIMLSVCGVMQNAETDYTVSGNTISWNNKGIDNIGLMAGDTFVIHYTKA